MSVVNGGGHYATLLDRFCQVALTENPSPYRNNYLGGHARSMALTHPTVAQVLGDHNFPALARVYVENYPPNNWDINLYGEHLAELLAAQCHGGKGTDFDWPWLAHMARIEYGIAWAYYQPDTKAEHRTPFLVEPLARERMPDTATLLQSHHAGVDIKPELLLTRPIAIWRAWLRVRVANYPHPGDYEPLP